MNCRRCGRTTAIKLRRHRLAYCRDCFVEHCRGQVASAIKKYDMIRPGERLLVAVAGGKDSLAVWDLLRDLGYAADSSYLKVETERDGDRSGECARTYAVGRHAALIEVDAVSAANPADPRPPIGRHTSEPADRDTKRSMLNQVALEGGYPVLVTGHNLDDEAAVLFGNVLRWDFSYVARQWPSLPESAGVVRRVKPLVHLDGRETAAYCSLQRIDYVPEESSGHSGDERLGYVGVMKAIEEHSPGAIAAFYDGFLQQMKPLLDRTSDANHGSRQVCASCGTPTTGEFCAFCRLTAVASVTGASGRHRRAVSAQGGMPARSCRRPARRRLAEPVDFQPAEDLLAEAQFAATLPGGKVADRSEDSHAARDAVGRG